MTLEPQGWPALLIPPSLLVPVAAVHVLVHRLTNRRSIVGSFLIAFGAISCTFLVARLHALAGAGFTLDGLAGVATDLVIFTGLSYAYCDFLAYGEASVRARILEEIGRAGDAGLSVTDLLQRYNTRVIMDLRFERLAASGQIQSDGDRVFLGPNRFGQYLLARVYEGMRRVLHGRARARPRANAHSKNHGQVPQ